VKILNIKFFIFIFIVCSLANGCAFTGVGRHHNISSAGNPDEALSNDFFTLHCAGTLYSFMLSPIIPLPPVIPSYGALGNGDAWITFKDNSTSNKIISKVKIINSSKSSVFEQNLDETWHLPLPFKCKDLHDFTLILEHGISDTKEFKLIYKEGELDFNWGYLSQ